MNYDDLANLIFPDAKPVEYWEEKYPERDLPEGAVVSRFAPSPTRFCSFTEVYIKHLLQGIWLLKQRVFSF